MRRLLASIAASAATVITAGATLLTAATPADATSTAGATHARAAASTASAAENCVYGSISARYDQLGGAAGKLGQPTSCEEPTERSTGRFTTFQRGAIYWSPGTGAWDVSGSFRELWLASGYENGTFGYPTSGEVPIKAGGVFQNYQGGTFYWSPAVGAHSLSGDFRRFYASQGYENGYLGYPMTQEVPVRGGVFQVFEGGVLYWSPATGTHSVTGSFRGLYAAHGYENGELGYPTSQEVRTRDGGVYQSYQGGTMYWAPGLSPQVVSGIFLSVYGRNGYEHGCLGFPLTEPYSYEGYSDVQEFQGGIIWSTPENGAFADLYPRDPNYSQWGLYPRC
ncbi:LGFP repeat-containing protein [Kineococcus sp. SYSU DK006]|uniref:LGFP repeat-containing protein n=1 Tax=Kineococcus sp. SYSU DK006 TaxID=3383127 RepID=UPI003D7D34E6